MRYLLSFVFTFFVTIFSYSQNSNLDINGIEGLKINYKTVVKDSSESKVIGNGVLKELYKMGYLTASIDSFSFNKEAHQIYISKGKEVQWTQLKKGNFAEEALEAIDFAPSTFESKTFNIKQLNKLFEKVISFYENGGYPFVSIQLKDVEFINQNQISAQLFLEKNKLYKIDSIKVLGNSQIGKTYLLNYIGLYEGDLYQENKIGTIEDRIREIPFVTMTAKPEIQFFEEGVKIVLRLDEKKASRFDGVLGLLTNENTGKVELTGDVDLNLINGIKRGETFGLNWRKLKGNSQDLNLDIIYPYLFKTPFGVALDFKLFKRDTTFLDIEAKVGINYLLERGDFVSLFVENKTSNLLSRNNFADAIQIPELGDVRVNSFGLAYVRNKTNYKYNPTNGLLINLNFSAGRKELKKIGVLEQNKPELYDSIQLKTNQFKGGILLEYYIPIAQRSTIKIANRSASIYSERLYANELMRIGGLRTLRGFDEESISASTYSIFTLEYRFLLDQNSFFSIFSDYGLYENNTTGIEYVNDTPIGIGAGVSFETKAGIFTFNYAVGSQFDNPVDLRAAKIHFGFINFF
ncbi:MAG: outer membrane protein assembly factor BamA [Vicingaceae bacterium]|jgi:outer membrane protein assembly factor BamA